MKPIWCPGCGDFSVLSSLTKALAKIGVAPENVAVVSGIGCSSRIPAYTTCYGFHGVHAKRMKLAEQQEPQRLVHFRARQNYVVNGRVPPVLRPEFRRRFNLDPKIRRGVEQGPLAWSTIPGKLNLRPGSARKLAFPQPATVRTRTVPLGEAAARRTTEDSYLHAQELNKDGRKTARRRAITGARSRN